MPEIVTAAAIPQIFDRDLLRRRWVRACRGAPPDFLLARVIEDLNDRLDVTLRPFPRMLDWATPAPTLVAALSARSAREQGEQRVLVRAACAPEPASNSWTTLVCDAECLPFAPETFDLVVSAFALHWVNDLPGTLIQIRRTLSADGLFIGAMIGGQSLHELRTVLAMAEEEITGGVSPRVAPFADLRDMGGLLQRAGFALPVTDIDTVTVRYRDIFALMTDLRAMGATNALVARSRRPLRRTILLRAAQLYAQMFADEVGRIRATFEIIWLSGWAPHESQQKPLQPGSAKMRLADALGTLARKPNED